MLNSNPSLVDKIDEHRMSEHDDHGSDKVDQIMQLVSALSDEEKQMLIETMMDEMRHGGEHGEPAKKPGMSVIIGVGKPKDEMSA